MLTDKKKGGSRKPQHSLGLFIFVILSFLYGCGRSHTDISFSSKISSYAVGKHTIRYSYKYPYLAIITRKVFERSIKGKYNFTHYLTIVKLPDFDTVFIKNKLNLEWFELWKIKNDTIFGFMGDGIPRRGPVWEYFKNIRMVKIVPGKGIVHDTVLFVANGQMGGTKHMWIVSNGKMEYLMFDYDFKLHLIDISNLKYIGNIKERSLFLKNLEFKGSRMFISVVGSKIPGHGNDLYEGVVRVDRMRLIDLKPVFVDSIRNVYGVVAFGDKNNFLFTAGDGMFAHHIYAYYKGQYKIIFSFPDNTIPFITGGPLNSYGVFLATLGKPLSFYSEKAVIGLVYKDELLSINNLPLPDSITFIYPPRYYALAKNGGVFILDVFSKYWNTDSIFLIYPRTFTY